MSDKKQRIEHNIRRKNSNVVHSCLHVAFFFAAAALLTFYFFNDFLKVQVAKPENVTWLNAEVQSQLMFAFRCLSEIFFIFALSSLSIAFFYMADSLISQVMKRIKNKSVNVSN